MSSIHLVASEPRGSRLATLGAILKAWYRRRVEVRALERLDDRTLADIGLRRSEIGSIVAEQEGLAERTRLQLLRPSHRVAIADRAAPPTERRHAA